MSLRKLALFLFCFASFLCPAQNHAKADVDNTGTSLFSGQLYYTIPIYTINDPDFQLDIALRYHSEGFKPFQPSGCYGQDWTLVAGGCISRSVQGLPDEQRLDYNGDTIFGMHRFFQAGELPNKYDVFNMQSSVYDTCGVLYDSEYWNPCKHKVDYMPDIFYFNFCGYKGRFMINNQGEISILSGDYIKVDISQLKDNQSFFATTMSVPNSGSRIYVQTLDGYTYVFGGTSSSLEYSVLTKRNQSDTRQSPPAVSTWHLTRIIAPNGRFVKLNYASGTSQQNFSSLHSFITDYDWSEEQPDSIQIKYFLHKDCMLQSIVLSDSAPLNMSFHSSTCSYKMYEHSDFTYCFPHSLLDSITISCGGNILRTARLLYQKRSYNMSINPTTNFNWTYLRQVKISGIGVYDMDYEFQQTDTTMGAIPYLSYYPYLYVQTNSDYKNMVDRFGFWKTYSLQGMLRQVTIPTGGKIKFTYGNHQYGQERRYRVVVNQDIEQYFTSMSDHTIGGVRIEKIETFSDDNTLVETKSFSYNKQGTSNSSGIFYNIYEVFYYSGTKYPVINPNNYGMIDSHVGYSYVTQTTKVGADQYKTAYTFNIGVENYSSAFNESIHRNTDINGYNAAKEMRSGSLTYPAKIMQTGKVMTIDQYVGNSIVKSIKFQYNGIPNSFPNVPVCSNGTVGCTDTIVALSKYSGHIIRKLYVYPDVLEKVITYEYDADENTMITGKMYTYDSKFRRQTVFLTDSKGRCHFTSNTYPDNISVSSLSTGHPLYMLKQSHRINQPIETVSGYIDGNTEYITSGTVNLYKKGQYVALNPNMFPSPTPPILFPGMDSLYTDTLIGPYNPIGTLTEYPYLHKTLSLALTSPIQTYQYMAVVNDSIVYDPNYRLSCEYNFNGLYRPILVKPFGKAGIQYTWDKSYDIHPSTQTIGDQTTTYTHIPYVGIRSVMDPRGITTYYNYDSVGRLVEEYQIIEEKKQILNVYLYHIKTE